MLVENLNETTHVGAAEVRWQVNVHVDAGDRLLFLLALVHDHNRITDIFDTDLVDGDVAIVSGLLHIGHAAGFASVARGVWRMAQRTLVFV